MIVNLRNKEILENAALSPSNAAFPSNKASLLASLWGFGTVAVMGVIVCGGLSPAGS